jgi:hypothetical protein
MVPAFVLTGKGKRGREVFAIDVLMSRLCERAREWRLARRAAKEGTQ